MFKPVLVPLPARKKELKYANHLQLNELDSPLRNNDQFVCLLPWETIIKGTFCVVVELAAEGQPTWGEQVTHMSVEQERNPGGNGKMPHCPSNSQSFLTQTALTWGLRRVTGSKDEQVWIPDGKSAYGISELHTDGTELDLKNWKWQGMRMKRRASDHEKACLCSSNSLSTGNANGCLEDSRREATHSKIPEYTQVSFQHKMAADT